MKSILCACLGLWWFGLAPAHAADGKPLTREDVLSIQKGALFLEGKPFAEISFNKFDLLWQLYDELAAGRALSKDNPMVRAQEKALRNLHKLGFRSVRVFALPWGPAGPESYANPDKRKLLFAALDKMVELCEAQDIRLDWSLGAAAFTDTKLEATGWVLGAEQERELVADRESRGRQLLYRYIDEVVSRYRGRKVVMMWEISNEVTLQADIGDAHRVYNGERMPTLKEVAGFFDEVARRIKAADPLRLVNSGGSNMRECQWHLHLGEGWKVDSFEDQFKCFDLLYGKSAIDVIDIHSYPNGHPGYAIHDSDGKKLWLDDRGYMTIAERVGKPLIIGELGLQAKAKTDTNFWKEIPDYFESFGQVTAARPWVEKTLDSIVDAGVPLSYWWCYQSDRAGDQNDPQRFDLELERDRELMALVVKANERLKRKWLKP